jgi:hypothetical protein
MQDSGTYENESWQSLAPSDLAAVRHWFVESDGSYIGPMEVGEVERMWRAGEIGEQTRAWTDGMPDWQPIADVPDLMYLAAEVRQHPATPPPAPEWQTTKAASLSALVEAELTALSTREVPAQHDPSLPGDLPVIEPVAGADPFARWWTERRPPADPTPWPKDPWAARAATSDRRPRRMGVLAAVAAAVLVGGGLGIVVARPYAGRVRQMLFEKTHPAVAAVPPRAHVPEPEAPLAAVTPPAVTRPAATPTETHAAEATEARRPTETRRPAPRPRAVAAARPRLAAAEPAPAPAAAPSVSLAPLTAQEIVAATRGQLQGLAGCVQKARAVGDVQPQKYTFLLDWHVRADGSVSRAALKGPADVLGSPLAKCFEMAMRTWRYRASADDFDVTNFPLPVTVR